MLNVRNIFHASFAVRWLQQNRKVVSSRPKVSSGQSDVTVDDFFASFDDCACIIRQLYRLIATKKTYNDPCFYDSGNFDNNLIPDEAGQKRLDTTLCCSSTRYIHGSRTRSLPCYISSIRFFSIKNLFLQIKHNLFQRNVIRRFAI